LGLLLHDIGKLAIPTEVLRKPGKLTPPEWQMMKTHPRAGFELLRGTPVSPLVRAVVLRHHERWNGSGYPDGKLTTEIHEMARIAAVADVYDAITSERPYAPARGAHVGVREIVSSAGTLFDPYIVDVFSRLVAPYPPGVEVELTDGRRAIVASVPPGELDRPVVRVIDGPGAPHEISLQQDRGLGIAGWQALSPANAA
jgi:HD-GYP domain-containing protein (c-di-GMP phosphodiesterase class II)